jgi:hypothetical protein
MSTKGLATGLVVASLAAALATCGVTRFDAGQTGGKAEALAPQREVVVDFDALFADPAMQRYMDAAAFEGSPCAPLLGETLRLAEELAPIIAEAAAGAPNIPLILKAVPDLLDEIADLLACVQSQQNKPAGPAPHVPAWNAAPDECLNVKHRNNAYSTCEDSNGL